MITIDGSIGEGGGQILRSSLALSLHSGQPFRLEKIRAGRAKPGLMRQHLMSVQAAAQIGQASVEGAGLGSQTLVFKPGRVQAGDYTFSIGTAGSCALVLQAVLPVLTLADGESNLVLKGGTHNGMSPPFEFIERVFLPNLAKLGPEVQVQLKRPGFYPAGGGEIHVHIKPVERLGGFRLERRGKLLDACAMVRISQLAGHIAKREIDALEVHFPEISLQKKIIRDKSSIGPGNAVMLEFTTESGTHLFSNIGRRGVPAERISKELAGEGKTFLAADVPVCAHLADQLLLPLSFGEGGCFITEKPTAHTETNAHIIRQFLDVSISMKPISDHQWRIEVCP